MKLFKRDDSPYWYMRFMYKGKQICRSSETTVEGLAKRKMKDLRDELKKKDQEHLRELQKQALCREFGISEELQKRGPIPTLAEFAALPTKDHAGGQWWTDYATNHYKKEKSKAFYRDRAKALLTFKPLATARLSAIDEKVLDDYITHLEGQEYKGATINNNMQALRLILKKARRWKLIPAVPEFPKRMPEDQCGLALTLEQEKIYFDIVSGDQHLFALICLDTGMEPGEISRLRWSDVYMKALGHFEHGMIHDRCAKRATRTRDLPMTVRLLTALKQRWMSSGCPQLGYVFPAQRRSNQPTPLNTFQAAHRRLWEESDLRGPIPLPWFRLYDFRHTHLTRFYEATKDVVALKNRAGWTSIAMTDRYVHASQKAKGEAARHFNAYLEADLEAEQSRTASIN